ncbi:MAG: M56 family metallopeptidase [Oscillospiraceae bacterium]|nr:M56 family metallopeptidase [Oscillospiraceae bacterium]
MMLNWIISSSLLIVAVIVLRFALRGKVSPAIGYALWLVVLVRLLVPGSVMHIPFSAATVVENTQLSQDLERLEYVDAVEHADDGSVLGIMHDAVFNTEIGGWKDSHTIVDYSADEEEFSRWQRSSNVKNFGKNILRPAWIAGIVLVAVWFAGVNMVFTRRLRRSRQRLEVDCPRPVYISDVVETPCLHGLISPAIYVTPAVAADETALRHVLSHELSHYRHGDHIWGIFRAAALALHWYNPLVWWAAALSRRDAELSCDEAAIALLGEGQRTDYGRTLIGLSCRGGGRDLLLNATTMTGSKRGLRERIVLIAEKPQTKAAAVFFAAVILIFAAVFTFGGSVPGSSYIRASSAEPMNEDFRLRYDKTITTVRLVCDVYQDGELLQVEDRVFPASAVEHIKVEPRLKGLDSRDYDIVVTIEGSIGKQEIVFDVTTGYSYALYGWSTPNMPQPVKLAVDDSVMLMIFRAGEHMSIPAGDELTANMLRYYPERTAAIRLEFYGDEKSAREQGSGLAYENPLVMAADNLHRFGDIVYMTCENSWKPMDDNVSLYTRYRFGNLERATLSVKYYQKGQLIEEAQLPYDLRLSRYGCYLTPTENGWQASADAYDYALTRPTDSIGITIPVSGTPQVQNRYSEDIGEMGENAGFFLKVGQTYCLATAVWGDSVSRWGGEYEETPELIAEAEHLVLYELTVEEHGGDRYGEYMSGVRPLYIHLPPELTSWELPNEHGEGVITGAVVPVGNQGYALTKDEYLEMTENGTDITTILSNRRYWAMEYADYLPDWVRSAESVTGTGDFTGAFPEWSLRVATAGDSTPESIVNTFANEEIICTTGALTFQNTNDFPIYGGLWSGDALKRGFSHVEGFALNPGEWVTLHNIAPDIIHSVSVCALVEEDTEIRLTVFDHDACHDE